MNHYYVGHNRSLCGASFGPFDFAGGLIDCPVCLSILNERSVK